MTMTMAMTTWAIKNGHRVVNGNPEPRKAHPGYRLADPAAVAEKLSRAGFLTRLSGPAMGARAHRRHPSRAILEVHAPWGRPGETFGYHGAASIYFDHAGRSAVKIVAGAMRVACENMFYAPYARLHHCSQDLADFLDCPVPLINQAILNHGSLPERVESLRGAGAGRAGLFADFLGSRAPRLAKLARAGLDEYRSGDLWAGMQALTAPSRPRLDAFAGRLLADTEAWNALRYDLGPETALALERHWN